MAVGISNLPTDHPRSRGVYKCMLLRLSRDPGSSPLARGLHIVPGHHERNPRIIPARAGFTLRTWLFSRLRRDHPRSRGVYGEINIHAHVLLGSSPLARGLPCSRDGGRCRARIIPARAGFTDSQDGGEKGVEDHPRSRGVYDDFAFEIVDEIGSSPLARGLPGSPINDVSVFGIIPARAGFTWTSKTSSRRRGDHPRSRGVYWWRQAGISAFAGSSPLARGLPRQ